MTITAVTFSMLVVLLVRLGGAYGWRVVLHPGSWFAFAWITASLSYRAIDAVGGVPVHDDRVLEQLMVLVLVTAVSFFVLTFLCVQGTDREAPPKPKPNPPLARSEGLYRLFAGVGLVGAVVNWAALGATFGYDDSIRQQWLKEIPPVTAMTWYLYFLSFPAAVFSGYAICSEVLQGKSLFRWKTLQWVTPAVAGFIWSLGTGGRQALGILLFHFAAGAAFSLAWAVRTGYKMSMRRALRLFAPVFVIGLLFALFVGLTGLSRAQQQGAAASSFDNVWYLAPVGQLISYNGLTLATHQAYGEPALRDLSDTGPVSLAGFQYFGLRLITGWRPLTVDDTNPERALAASGLALASGTRNVFYDFQADFGFEGAIGVSLILTLVSHLLFLKSSFAGHGSLLRAAPLAMALMFWGYSHQFSLLMFNTFFWLVVSSALWDVAGLVFRRRHLVVSRDGR